MTEHRYTGRAATIDVICLAANLFFAVGYYCEWHGSFNLFLFSVSLFMCGWCGGRLTRG